jgi:hypothetical protein
MGLVAIILAAACLWLLSRLGRQVFYNQVLVIQNKHLESVNAMLRARCQAPDVEVSNFTDSEAALAFAVECGYAGALVARKAGQDSRPRPEALRSSLDYYRRHVADVVASANH